MDINCEVEIYFKDCTLRGECSTLNANTPWEHQEKAVNRCDATIAFINSLKLSPLCDHILQATDAGPGVSVTNIEVKLRCPGLIAGLTLTGFTGHHTIQDKTKRSNAAIGEEQ